MAGGKRGGKTVRSSRPSANEGKRGGPSSRPKSGMRPLDGDRNHNAPPGPPEAASTPKPDVIALPLATPSLSDLKPLMDLSSDKLHLPPVDTSLIKYVSPTTGLTVLTIVSNLPGHLVSLADRAYFIRILPNVIIINSSGKGESVIVGMDAPPDLVISTVEKLEKDTKNWSFNLEDVSGQDPFCFFRGWNIIPCVDKLGMYSLIVNLRLKGKTRMAEMEERKSLLTLIKEFNISKSMHGEGETMLQMSHVLEFVTYSDCIRKQFALERRHTWQIKLLLGSASVDGGAHKHFLIKVDSDDITKLSVAHKQFAVNHHLGTAGKVIQLEHDLFGVPNHYLAVFDGKEKLTLADLGPCFQVIELAPTSLPDFLMPTYGVDDFGFYTVSGTFPQNIDFELREKFSADMKKAGAVGFRSGASDEEFSLHFVNSRCLEQINKTGLYTGLNLKIHSSLVKKASLEKKIRKLVPAILKIKEVQNRSVEEVKGIKKVTIVEEPKDISRSSLNTSRSSLKSKDLVKAKAAASSSVQVNYEQTPVKGKIQDKEEIKKVVTEVAPSPSSSPPTASKVVATPEVAKKEDQVIEFSESDLLKINWTGGKGIPPAAKNIGRFFNDIGKVDIAVDTDSMEVKFKAHDKEKVLKNLKKLSHPETNSFEKLKKVREPKFFIQESKAEGMFGLSLPKKKIQKSDIEKMLLEYSEFKIEDRAGVNIIWFKTKMNYFQALIDAKLNVGMYPCIVNFKDSKKADGSKVEPVKKDNVCPTPTKTSGFPPPPKIDEQIHVKSTSEKKVYQLSEKEVFGFILKRPDVRTRVRDDQVISRQLTEFIKTVNCTSIDNNEDGLVFNFSSKEAYNKALNQFFPEAVTDPSLLDTICRKFTLIPSRGSFGIFTSKRIRLEDLKKFGDCKLNMCSLWFADKMEVIRILRDPRVAKMYPALYIDCRNIFILKSIRAPIPAPDGYLPSYKSVPRFSPMFPSPRPFYPVMGLRPPRPRYPAYDPAIVRSGPDFRANYHTSVLSQILPRTTQTNFHRPKYPGSFKYDFMVGKFGVLPSSRFIKNGYKIFKNPDKGPSSLTDCDLFLDDKDQYRNKKAEDAADEVKNILEGNDGARGTLKDMKMRRVEKFLKANLGVDAVEILAENNNSGPNSFVNLVESGSSTGRFEDSADSSQDTLTPDLLGLYTISVPVTKGNQNSMISSLEEDVSWFEPPVSVLPVTDLSSGDLILEVKMKEEAVAIATYQGLRFKYPGMDVDKTGNLSHAETYCSLLSQLFLGAHVDIIADKETGMFMLVFVDRKHKKYAGTIAQFKKYCMEAKNGPFIAKGQEVDEVLVGFKVKEEAIQALKENLDNEDFPELCVAPSSRS